MMFFTSTSIDIGMWQLVYMAIDVGMWQSVFMANICHTTDTTKEEVLKKQQKVNFQVTCILMLFYHNRSFRAIQAPRL